MLREILTALGAMIGAFMIFWVAFAIAVVILFGFIGAAYGNIQRNGVVMETFENVIVNDVYEDDTHVLRQFVVVDTHGAEDKMAACLVTKLDAFTTKRGDYHTLIWTDFDGQIHLWRFRFLRRSDTNGYDLHDVYNRLSCYRERFAYDWQTGNGPTPARKR